MADRKDQGEEDEQDMLFMQQRLALNNAYAALQGRALADGFGKYTLRDALQEQADRISGPDQPYHPNLINKVEAVRLNLVQAVAQIKKIPPEKFRDAALLDSVNREEN